MNLELDMVKARQELYWTEHREEYPWELDEDHTALIARVETLEAAIRAKCAYCRESWDAGLDDPAFCPTNCPLLPYRGGE